MSVTNRTYRTVVWLINGEVESEDYCHGCASGFLPGKAYAGGFECVAIGQVEIGQAPKEGARCAQCCRTVAPAVCTLGPPDASGWHTDGCGERVTECICTELVEYDRYAVEEPWRDEKGRTREEAYRAAPGTKAREIA